MGQYGITIFFVTFFCHKKLLLAPEDTLKKCSLILSKIRGVIRKRNESPVFSSPGSQFEFLSFALSRWHTESSVEFETRRAKLWIPTNRKSLYYYIYMEKLANQRAALHGVNTIKCKSSYISRHFDFRSSLLKQKMKLNILWTSFIKPVLTGNSAGLR